MLDSNELKIRNKVEKIADYLIQGKNVIVIGGVGSGKTHLIDDVKTCLINSFKKKEVYMRQLENQGGSDIIACIPDKIAVFVADYDSVKKAQKFVEGDFQQAKDLARGGQITSLIGTYPVGLKEMFINNEEIITFFNEFDNVKSILSTTLPTEYVANFEKGNTVLVFCYHEIQEVVECVPKFEYTVEIIQYS